MKFEGIFQCFMTHHQLRRQRQQQQQIFSGSDEYLIKNGELLLKERISLFDGRTNPIHCFSLHDLNSMNVNNGYYPVVDQDHYKCYARVSDGRSLLVKIFCNIWRQSESQSESERVREEACREIAVATQMATHSNVHRLLGVCLLTNYPVLVYEWAENGTLYDRIFRYKQQSKQALEWEDRLRIASEIAHSLSYLHTAFRRPIIHRNLQPGTVFLDQDDSARLSDFSLSISIPEGKKHVEDMVIGTWSYLAPEYTKSGRLTESVDVFSFGALLLILLTGKMSFSESHGPRMYNLVSRVSGYRAANTLVDIVDPAITRNGSVADEHFQCHLKAFTELALRCTAQDEERRPTMVEVATELKSMVMSSSASL